MAPGPEAPLMRAAALLCALVVSAPAGAQRAPIDVEHFRPQVSGRGLFHAESADLHAPWQWGAGLILHYAKNPLIASSGRDKLGDAVDDRLTGSLLLSLGLLRWLEVGLALPVSFWNDKSTDLLTGASAAGLGMLRFQLKFRLLTEGLHGVGLAFLPVFLFPTGDRDAFLGQSGVVFSPALLVERHVWRLRFLVNIGYTVRQEARFLTIGVDDELFWKIGVGWRALDKLEVGAEIAGATAAASPFGRDERHNPMELLVGARVLLSDRLQIYAGLGPGLTYGYGSPTIRLFAGVVYAPHERDTDGDGVPDRIDRCPREAGPARYQGCPTPDADNDGIPNDEDRCPTIPGPRENQGCPWPDTDGDGIPDKDDRCPKVPGPKENQGCPWPDTDGDGVPDKDDRCPKVPGPRENQGCPWPDTDGDGIPDKDDRCPTVPGPRENQGCPWPDSDGDGVLDKEDDCPKVPGPKDNRGCPRKRVDVTPEEIKVAEQVNFRTDSATLLPESHAVLDEVAARLKAHPEILRVEIQGHTDDRASRAYNVPLSRRRAEAVRAYLISKGIEPGRLVARGYGEERPLVPVDPKRMAPHELRAARARNRRVQFVILKRK
jgi:outer membrane protein OmpA-like peptidoglycan-associated protein